MAALNRQLTEDEARQLIKQWRSMTSIPSFYDMLVEDCWRFGTSWYCEQCAVEVYERRCPHCGKLEKDKS